MSISPQAFVVISLVALTLAAGCSAPIQQTGKRTVVAPKPPRGAQHATPPKSSAKPPAPKKTAAKPPAAKSKQPIGTAHQLELVREYRQGVASFEAGHLEEAVGYFEAVQRWRPHYQEVDTYLRKAYIAIGMKQYTNGDLEGAIRIWKEALKIDPKDEQALAYIRKTERELRQIDKKRSGSTP